MTSDISYSIQKTPLIVYSYNMIVIYLTVNDNNKGWRGEARPSVYVHSPIWAMGHGPNIDIDMS